MTKYAGTQDLKTAYDPERFRTQGYKVIDMLADYLKGAMSREIPIVLPHIAPDEMLNLWTGQFPDQGTIAWQEMIKMVLEQSNHLHHPRYVGHQVTAPLPLAALMDLIAVFLNNGSAVYEMGPVNVVMEKRIIEWMAQLIGFDKNADGVFTSGGTLGNLTALLAARQARSGYDVWQKGIDNNQKFTVMISEQSHYSVERAVRVMGLGGDSIEKIPVDDLFRIDMVKLKERYIQIRKEGKQVLALVANGCSTATGSYDKLDKMADFCQQEGIWLHVDGAHGASALLSEKYRSLLEGIDRVDSIVWDAHKMLLMPALTTAVIFRDGSRSFDSFSQEAAYLFEKDSREEWYNFAHRTMECTKKMMGLKMYVCLNVLGQNYFRQYIDSVYDLTREFGQMILKQRDFELAVTPQSNIICFRYVKDSLDAGELNELQARIRSEILKNGTFYVVQARLKGKLFLRCTVINPLTTIDDLSDLLDLVRRLAV